MAPPSIVARVISQSVEHDSLIAVGKDLGDAHALPIVWGIK